MWRWHCAEESEHRGTAFDVYRALGGDDRRRRRWMLHASLRFGLDLCRQTVMNLRHDGLFRWRTARGAALLLFGREGLVRRSVGRWLRQALIATHPRKGPIPKACISACSLSTKNAIWSSKQPDRGLGPIALCEPGSPH
ncbi:MAG: metal-dependent hydrolase [Burkholderiaceae bacterium]